MQLKNNEANSSLYSNLAGMYTKRDQFVIPLTHTFCGNLVTTKASFTPAKQSKTASLNIVEYNTTSHICYTLIPWFVAKFTKMLFPISESKLIAFLSEFCIKFLSVRKPI